MFVVPSLLLQAGSLVAALSCGMWDLVPRPGIATGPPALGAKSLSHWTTKEVPLPSFENEDTANSFLLGHSEN